MATVQIRNLDDRVYAELKAEAEARGISLSEHLRRKLERWAGYPAPEVLAARIAERRRDDEPTLEEVTAWVREDRDSR